MTELFKTIAYFELTMLGLLIFVAILDRLRDWNCADEVDEMNAEEFLKLLAENGGAITSSDEHSLEEFERAFDEERYYADSDGNGYIWDLFEEEE